MSGLFVLRALMGGDDSGLERTKKSLGFWFPRSSVRRGLWLAMGLKLSSDRGGFPGVQSDFFWRKEGKIKFIISKAAMKKE